jgi:hypothetical protein
MNEVDLTRKIMIGLFVFELIGILLGYFLGTTNNVPALSSLHSLTVSIQNKTTALTNAFNYQLLKPLPGSGFLGTNAVANALILFFNLLARIANFVIQLIVVLAYMLYVLLFMLFVALPGLLLQPSLGALGYIFTMVYAVVTIIIGVYALRLIIDVAGRFLGGTHVP